MIKYLKRFFNIKTPLEKAIEKYLYEKKIGDMVAIIKEE
jgi:hypothetical protein